MPELLDPDRAPADERARDLMELTLIFGDEDEFDDRFEGFVTIKHTYEGKRANLDQLSYSALESKASNVHLAFKRREPGDLRPAISNIDIVYTNVGRPAPGYTLIETTLTGRSANLVPSSSKGVFLAVRRQDAGVIASGAASWEEGASRYAHHLEPAVQDVSVVLVGKGEAAPPQFELLDKKLNTRGMATKTCLAVRRGPAVGLCDIPFRPQLLDRAPRADHADYELPHEMVSVRD